MSKKKKWFLILISLALFGLIFYIFFIRQKTDKETYTQRLAFLHFNIQVETKDLLKWEKASRFHLYKGWFAKSIPPEANDKESVIRFFCFNLKDRTLYLELENLYYSNAGSNLVIDLLLNGEFIKQIEVFNVDIFHILCPGEKLKRGENFITLKLVNDKIDGEEKRFNERIRYYNLREIYFEDIDYSGKMFVTLQNKSDMLHQPNNSIFRIAVDTSESKKLCFTVKPLRIKNRRCKLTVQMIKTDLHSQKSKEIRFDNKIKKEDFIEFKQNKKKIILEFNFSSTDPENFLVWEKIELLNIKKKKEQPPMVKPLEKKPHVFLIIIDAARFDVVNEKFEGKQITPHINVFSRCAHNFTNFYANAPYTGPSVASMLTGYLPEIHTVRGGHFQLPEEIKILPEYFFDSGYKTHVIVGNLMLFCASLVKKFGNIFPIRSIGGKREKENSSYNNIDKAVSVIKLLDPEVPNFVYFHFLPPHAPYNPPAQAFKIFTTNNSDESLESFYRSYLNNYFYADFLVGRVLGSITERGLFDNSLIIITSDHGEAFGEHKIFGHIETNYREMIHVPFLIKLPNQKNKVVIRDFYSFVDLLPTFAALLNIPVDKNWQGIPISFDSRRDVFNDRFLYSRAIGKDFNNSIFNRDFKYIFSSGRDELFDLKKDLNELKNIADQNHFLTLYIRQKLFQVLSRGLFLKNKLEIKEVIKKFDNADMIRELKILGYL